MNGGADDVDDGSRAPSSASVDPGPSVSGTEGSPSTVARRPLERVRREQPTESPLRTIANFEEDDLDPIRTDRETALAFWLNVYNAATQLLLDRRPASFESR